MISELRWRDWGQSPPRIGPESYGAQRPLEPDTPWGGEDLEAEAAPVPQQLPLPQ